jgi:succinyl-diaminopimelate desuccinylase
MQSITNLIVRRRFGDGGPARRAERARRRGAARRGLDATTPTAARSSTAGSTAAPRRSARATSPPTPSRCARSESLQGLPLRGGVELHFTYDEEFGGELGPGWLLRKG